MRTIGKIIRDSRLAKNYSLTKLEKETKIKKDFIDSVEREEWEKLPEYPVVQGFIKNLASALNLDRNQTLAILRRDYPPTSYKALKINPKPDVTEKFIWSPRLTFLTGVFVVIIGVAAYLVIQYVNFIRPPRLDVLSPKEGDVIITTKLIVNGVTDQDASVKVDNQPAYIDENGNFTTEIEIYDKTEEIEVRAISRGGKETVVYRKIKPELK